MAVSDGSESVWLELAEQMAAAGDHATAEEFRREAARIREAASPPTVETPPVETPPVEIPPVVNPPVVSPPVETFPIEAPPNESPFEALQIEVLSEEPIIERTPITAAEPGPHSSGVALNARMIVVFIVAMVASGVLGATLTMVLRGPVSSGRINAPSTPPPRTSAPLRKAERAPAKPPGEAATPERENRPSADLPGEPAVMAARVCRMLDRLATASDDWPCAEATGEIPAGSTLYFYTRVRSARDSRILHRWYHRNDLYQSVELPVRANQSKGFRTYSVYTIKAGSSGNWRVEVRSAAGTLLDEKRFIVR
jgi:hypothetical protein